MGKSPDAFRTISEVSSILETPAHVLRFWESKFPQIKPVKRAGGRRYYRPDDIALLGGIKSLLHEQGVAIRGVQKLLREQGSRHVAALSLLAPEAWAGPAAEEGSWDPGRDAPAPPAPRPEAPGWTVAAEVAPQPIEPAALSEAPASSEGDGAPFAAPPRAAPTLAAAPAPTFVEGVLQRTLARFDEPDLRAAGGAAGGEAEGEPRAATEMPAASGTATPGRSGPRPADDPGEGRGRPPASPRRPRPEGEVSLAWLAERLAEADPARLRARAAEIAPLVRRLRDIREGMGA